MNRSSLVAVCRWLSFFGCLPSLLHSSTPVAGYPHQHPVDPLHQATMSSRGRVMAGALHHPRKSSVPISGGDRQTMTTSDGVGDQETSDTLINFGVGIGLETPLIDNLLQRLIRRKQQLLLAAAASSGYPVGGWGGGGPGFYPNPASLFPYAGGGAGGVGIPWNGPGAIPYPYAPPIDPYGLGGGVGLGSGVGLGGGVGFGGGVGIGSGWGGYNPLFDLDNFGWRNRQQQHQQQPQQQQQQLQQRPQH